MGATLTRPEAPLTVSEARRRLANTRGLSSEQVVALEQVVAAFHSTRPINRPCAACGSMIWREHETAAGDATWACAGCHRASSLTFEAWHAQLAAKREAEAVRAATEAAAAPEPSDALGDALAARDAVAGMRAAEQAAIERAAAGLTGERAVRADLPVDAARSKLRLGEDALQAARGARALIDDKLHYAKSSLASARAVVRSAALAVLAAEEFETTLATAVAARADYLEAIGALSWLIRNHCIPNGDVRPNQLVAEASETPPSRWPEAADAGARLAQRLAALEGTP